MQPGEIYKYLPTSTVGKVQDVREVDGKVWALLDFTGLWYDASALSPADASEYKETSFKYRESSLKTELQSVEDLINQNKEVNIDDFNLGGAG
ncbi:MAG: DUF2098 domain-containing protein [Candidatus Methanomethylophilaceae archaeon]